MRKLKYIVVALLLVLLMRHENAFAFAKGAEQECVKCHSFNAEEAGTLLKTLVPDIKILEIKDGPIKGFWEVDFESGGKKSLFYVDFSKRNIISGNIFDIKTKINYTKESFDKLNKVDVSQIPLDNALVMGDKNAKNKIIVFDDPD
jgi:thiol:disulfide interchange protein DsbC